MPEDSKEQRKEYIAGLLREKEGVEQRLRGAEDDESKVALKDQVKAIDVELSRMGHEAKAPAKRAESRPASREHESR